jgi:hypothetical protein
VVSNVTSATTDDVDVALRFPSVLAFSHSTKHTSLSHCVISQHPALSGCGQRG